MAGGNRGVRGMMRRNRNRRDDLPLTADINVTSLVDVAFTLLVIFIITAPVLQGGIEVSVPEADVRPLTAQDDPTFVSVDRQGTVYLHETPFDIQEFRTAFPQLMGAGDVERVYIRTDSLAPAGRILQVMGVAQAAGVDFAMVGTPWDSN